MTSLKEKQGKHGKFACCKPDLYDGLYLLPSSKRKSGYKTIFKQVKTRYNTDLIDSDEIPGFEHKTPLIISMPDKKHRIFKLFIKKRFMAGNKQGVLELLKRLISHNTIKLVKGAVSYDFRGSHFFINMQTFPDIKNIPIMHRIALNYDNADCLFKHKANDAITMLCEIRSPIYPFNKDYEIWNYSMDYTKKNGRISALTDFHVLINRSGNVKFTPNAEKLNILAREFYAKNIDEGVAILAGEMKNLGFNTRIAEKRRCK